MVCAATARAEAEERHEEEVDRVHDEARARNFRASANRPDGDYVDRREPWPHTSSGVLFDDPAMDWR